MRSLKVRNALAELCVRSISGRMVIAMKDLVTDIHEKEAELWHLCVALQELKVRNAKVFKEQDFSNLREECKQILTLIGEVEARVV